MQTLRPGEVGCLLGGTFRESVTIRRGGSRGAPLTLTSAPGRRARIVGTLYVADSANNVVISHLNLDGRDGRHSPSPQINGDHVTLRGNNITNGHTGICLILGGSFERYGRARDTLVEGNRIHDCGRLPATNHDHGIYVEGTNGARIVGNLIYDNADWGIHLYPDAQHTYIAHNVIDGNGHGILFAGEGANEEYERAYASNNNVVVRNVITNSTIGANVESWWGGPVGRGNVARRNCLWNGANGNVDRADGGFVPNDNTVARPLFVNRGRKDFRLRPGSRCAGAGVSRSR